jgi:hypothetical protein
MTGFGGAITIPVQDNESGTNANTEAEAFLARVLPAPGPGRAISIHKPFIPAGAPKPVFPGRAHHTVASAVEEIALWQRIALNRHGAPQDDFYVSMSLLSGEVSKTSKAGRPYLQSTRRDENAVAIRSLFADLDVKPSAYHSQQEAIMALAREVGAGNLPSPTVVVNSGYGIHIYWTLDTELTPQQWRPLGEAVSPFLRRLKILHDPAVSSDVVRLMRVPGTWNMKDRSCPRPVRLLGPMRPADYPVSTFANLFNVVIGAARTAVPGAALNPAASSTTPPLPPAFAHGLPPHLQAASPPALSPYQQGLPPPHEQRSQPVKFEHVVRDCAVLADIAARGGNGDSEPLWNLVVYAASFAEDDGAEWAHKLSSGDPRYTHAETELKLEQKRIARERDPSKYGWPTCQAFNQHHSGCASCPHAGKLKSPLSLGKDDSDLPEGYYREMGSVWRDSLDSQGNPVKTCVLPYGIRDAFLEDTDQGPALNAQIIHARGAATRLRMTTTMANVWREKAMGTLGMAGISLNKETQPHAQRFIVAFIQHLQRRLGTLTRRDTFGWTRDRAGLVAFGTGARVWTATGFEAVHPGDRVMADKYMARGDVQPWKDVADFLIAMNRLDLQCVIASAFAAPLVCFTGQSGLLLSIYSPHSGVQKSTAMLCAQAVWGNPTTAMNRLDDSTNSVSNKLGLLRHLPIYWDELQTDQHADAYVKLAFALSQGTEKARLTADITQREAGSWATMLVSASNFSVQSLMHRHARNTTAGLNRVFEIEAVPGTTGLVGAAEASMMVGRLREHYGRAGEAYAQALAREHDHLQDRLKKIAESFEKSVQAVPEERFWVFTAATILLGAMFAKSLGLADFDVPGMQRFLADTILNQRKSKNDSTYDHTSPEFLAHVLFRYVQHCRARNTCLETDQCVRGAGRHVVNLKMPSDDARRALRSPVLHIARDAGIVRMLPYEFEEWIDSQELSRRVIIDGLEKHAGLTRARMTWAGGTEYASGQTRVFELIIDPARSAVGALFSQPGGPFNVQPPTVTNGRSSDDRQ